MDVILEGGLMGLDYMNLEERAKKKGMSVDGQWIKENETKDMLNIDSNVQKNLKYMNIDSDILVLDENSLEKNNEKNLQNDFQFYSKEILKSIEDSIENMSEEKGRSK